MSVPAASSAILLDGLPTEIQDLIFHYVVLDSRRDELKLFRQSNRYFRDRADLYLFRTLHISASNLSLDRVRRVSENNRINVNVRELVYHRGTFSGHKMVKSGRGGMQPRDYGDFKAYMVRGQFGLRQVDLMRVSKCYAAFEKELTAESDFNRELSWQTSMREYCSRFPKLESLTMLADHQDLESTYLKTRCGLTHQSWTPNYFAPYEIFQPCGPNFRPKALTLYGVNGEDFAAIMTFIRGGVPAVKERFSQLRELRLSFSETVNSLEVGSTYDIFVEACHNLRLISLDLSSFYSPKMLKDSDCFPQKLMKLFLQQHFRHLSNVDLTYAIMTEHDFISFLERHSKTIRSLKLRRWPMSVTNQGEATGSVIRALWKIGRVPLHSLQSINLEGEISSRKDGNGWSTSTDPDYHRQKHPLPTYSGVRNYLENCTGREPQQPFPFPIAEKTMLDAKTGKQLEALDVIPFDLGLSDTTFEWFADEGEAETPMH